MPALHLNFEGEAMQSVDGPGGKAKIVYLVLKHSHEKIPWTQPWGDSQPQRLSLKILARKKIPAFVRNLPRRGSFD